MSEVNTTAAELRPNDSVRFRDGEGTYVWATVCRASITAGSVEVLFTDGGGAATEYRTFPAERAVVRRTRPSEITLGPNAYMRCEGCGWSFPIDTTDEDERCTECDGKLVVACEPEQFGEAA